MKKWTSRGLALLFAGLLLVVVEGALRLSGYGGFPPLVREIGEVDGRMLHEIDTQSTQSYFFGAVPGRGSARGSNFFEPKGTNTVRIVLAGESAILGIPQPRPLTAGAFLEWGLEKAWPGKDVEIINLGTTAVASFPVYDLVRQLMPHQPDLLIVYAGNNEFYGSYGVGSSHYAGRHARWMPAARFLQGLAMTQALNDLVMRLRRSSVPDEILMERMMAREHIPADSPLRARAAANLAHHVNKMIDAGEAAGVPVIICTLAANEKDLAPIGSDEQAVDDAAMAMYRKARELSAAGEHAKALMVYQDALDADSMPWRPTSQQNDALISVARSRSVMLCDVRGFFRQLSPGGAIGWELMDDHVHFSLAGQYALALSLMRTMTEAPGKLRVPMEAVRSMPDWKIVAAELGANVYEQFNSDWAMSEIFSAGFMARSNPQAKELMFARMREAAGKMDPSIAEKFAATTTRRRTGPDQYQSASGTAAEMLVKEGNFASAIPLFDFAARSLMEYSRVRRINAAMMYGCLEATGQLDETHRAAMELEIKRGQILLQYGTDPTGITEFALAKICGMLKRETEAADYMTRALAKNPHLSNAWPWE